MKYLLSLSTAATVLVGAALPMHAATLTLDDVVVEGTGTGTPTKESVEGREIRESSAKDLADALKNVPGMDFVRKAMLANDVVLRGQYRDNINVLVDGQRIYGSCGSRMDPPAAHIDFGEVERVEVLKGPYDVEHSGSMAGMVNVITKPPKKGFGADLSLNYGSFQSLAGTGGLSYGSDLFSALGGYAYKTSQMPTAGGGKSFTDLYAPTSSNAYRSGMTNMAYEANTAWVKLGLTPGAGIDTRLDYTMQDAHHVLYPGLTMDAVADTMNRVNWTLSRDNLKMQAFWDSVDHVMDNRYRQAASASGQPTMSADARSALYGGMMNYAWNVGDGVLKAGVDGYSRNWNTLSTMKMGMGTSTSSSLPDVTLRDLGVYGEYAFKPLPQLRLQAGVRADNAHAEAAALNAALLAKFTPYYANAKASTDLTDFGGNLQATYALNDQVELFGGLGRAVRMPDPQELFSSSFSSMGTSTVGNPTLKPAKNHQVDLGARYRNSWLNLSASLFDAYAQDYIYVTSLAPGGMISAARTYSNMDAMMLGGELGAQASMPMNLYLTTGLGYVQGQNQTSGQPLAEMPPLRGTVSLRYDIDSFFVEVIETGATTQDRVDSSLKETATPGWLATDLKAGMKWNGATLLAGVNNLLDAYYTTSYAYRRDPFSSGVQTPEPGRNFYVGVSYRF